ncbi:TIGR03747 family integrating conjugative element membrane protein [Salmonella enterica]|uniref:TIGR03747 family integrating conjugative element membrane protein n=1 Tax=Salmonella enterica TaxID=28901 RepID=UPI0009AE522C|nr:TIGR03747 family integrating conjugative element membrane protein [Salmonella enterica]EAA2778350.1 TIGR03747 family integrating conjugative element membrane protein [Salmonella enterica subsp. enterica serovar Montevideo]EBZ3098635.1 TIGR03747 family integrating conjugative element membrane protein [Salmonella enterica subsp. enterica serovar Sandiego]EDB5722469.1 TIGR03747 family integrating conjugative element membrane protein [Salmonella enterica subsp. enterica serovar Rubislaw]EDL33616
MAEEQTQGTKQDASARTKRPGLLRFLLWELPWHVVGILLASLLFSLLIEYVGLIFWWPEQGSLHARGMMATELGYLSSNFTRSLLVSAPAETAMTWINLGYHWIFVDSGFIRFLSRGMAVGSSPDTLLTAEISALGNWLLTHLRDFLQATVYITVVFVVRVSILVLSVPLFVMVVMVAMVEGLSRRDLRRYGAGYESSFLYHHAKRFIKPAVIYPCMLYLSWPTAIYPNLILLPAALLLGVSVTVLMSTFKKYL